MPKRGSEVDSLEEAVDPARAAPVDGQSIPTPSPAQKEVVAEKHANQGKPAAPECFPVVAALCEPRSLRSCEKSLAIVLQGTHLFRGTGRAEEVARLSVKWVRKHLGGKVDGSVRSR